MKILVLGSGGREHALCRKLSESEGVERVYVIPGGDGMADVATPISVESDADILEFAKLMQVELTVAGPETVLTEGIGDAFRAAGLAFFGPSKAAAQIEGSKQFAKELMKKYHIPTADYEAFTDKDAALAYVKQVSYPTVIKADGLAAGKGVVIAQNQKEAEDAIEDMMGHRAFGEAGARVVIEEFMEGEEASVLAFCDGKTVVPMMPSQDHKRIFDHDEGPNTGGMGAYAPCPVMTDALMQEVREKILQPAVDGMAAEGTPFVGCLYAGLMMTKDGPRVVEFNCRFGDPETEVVLPLLDSDLAQIMLHCTDGTLAEAEVKWKPGYAVDVVLATAGYPGAHTSGDVIEGLETLSETGCFAFHAGTKEEDGHFVTAGGRVLNIVAIGATLPEAIEKAYAGVSKIRWKGMQYRKDIAQKGLAHLKQ